MRFGFGPFKGSVSLQGPSHNSQSPENAPECRLFGGVSASTTCFARFDPLCIDFISFLDGDRSDLRTDGGTMTSVFLKP